MKTPLVTREGYEKLKQELNYLWREERPEVTKKVTWAASLGDRSENADYQYNKKRLREIDRRVRTAMRRVALDYDKLSQRSVFELSGGQMRRVAIAGVLAMEPQTLVLDEPCAGLDPKGREEILGLISDLHRESGATIVMVSHSMDDVAALAERVIVMNHGKVAMDGAPREVFAQVEKLKSIGLTVPDTVELLYELRGAGCDLPLTAITVDECADAIARCFGKSAKEDN